MKSPRPHLNWREVLAMRHQARRGWTLEEEEGALERERVRVWVCVLLLRLRLRW